MEMRFIYKLSKGYGEVITSHPLRLVTVTLKRQAIASLFALHDRLNGLKCCPPPGGERSGGGGECIFLTYGCLKLSVWADGRV